MSEPVNPNSPNAALGSLHIKVMLVGVVCAILAGIGATVNLTQFLDSYLFSYLFILGIALGSLGLTMLHHMTGGDWGYCIRRVNEASAITMPVLAVLFIPIALGAKHLFPWANEDFLAGDKILQIQHDRWLNYNFWVVRACIYFAIWTILALAMWIGAGKFDRTGDPRIVNRMQKWCALGLIVYFVTMTSAAVDWIMTREAHWYSSIIGLVICVSQGLCAMALALALLRVLRHSEPFGSFVTPSRLNDCASLFLAMIVLWAYMSFAQLLIIWMGNIASDSPWYIRRGFSGDPAAPHKWKGIALLLITFHFFVPFFILLIRENKRHLGKLSLLGMLLLLMRAIDCFWWTGPSSLLDRGKTVPWLIDRTPNWQDFVVPLALFGIWMTVMLAILKTRPLLGRLEDGLEHDAHGDSAHAHAAA